MQIVLHTAFVRGGDMFFDLKGEKQSSRVKKCLNTFARLIESILSETKQIIQ